MAPSQQVTVARLSLVLVAILGAATYAEGQNLLSKLPNALTVTAALPSGAPITVVKVVHDSIVVTWKANTTGVPIAASNVRTELCFASESQAGRAWRATKDDLNKDKTCVHDIATAAYTAAGATVTFLLPNNIPGAKYFVRAYAVDVKGTPVAYGQSSPDKIANTFTVVPISGRNETLNLAAAIMSVLSVVLLFSFFVFESIYVKRKKNV